MISVIIEPVRAAGRGILVGSGPWPEVAIVNVERFHFEGFVRCVHVRREAPTRAERIRRELLDAFAVYAHWSLGGEKVRS